MLESSWDWWENRMEKWASNLGWLASRKVMLENSWDLLANN